MGLESLEDRRDATGRNAPLGSDHGQSVGEEGESHRVVEVGVAHEGVLDLDLLGDRERPAHRAGVHQHAVVHEEGSGPLARPLAAVSPENFYLHETNIPPSPCIVTIPTSLCHEPPRGQGSSTGVPPLRNYPSLWEDSADDLPADPE